MKNLEFTTTALSLEELVQIDGGVKDPNEGQISESGTYNLGGCIPNPFDKIFR